MFTLDDVDRYAKTLAGVSVGESWGRKTWLVNGKGFVWDRPLTKADIKRYGDAELPKGEILGVRVENLDAKDALLAMGLPGFFTIQHFNGWPGLLIELRLANAEDVRRTIVDAWTTMSTKKSKGAGKRVVSTTKKKATATKATATKATATKATATKATATKATATKATATKATRTSTARPKTTTAKKRSRSSKK